MTFSSISTSTGVKIPLKDVTEGYLSVLDLEPDKSQKTIVFLHGYAGVLELWEFQINYFVRQTYRVVAPDLRGHGQSDARLIPSTQCRKW